MDRAEDFRVKGGATLIELNPLPVAEPPAVA